VTNEGDKTRIQMNLEVIREYLRIEFKGFEVTDKLEGSFRHLFIVTKSSDERYQLKVALTQLSAPSNTPEKTKRRLVTDDVSGRMRGKSQGESFSWGKY
jgi:hypothetical protein